MYNTVHAILELFEDFLYKKGINIPNEDRDRDNPYDGAILYGMDYAELYDEINALLTEENPIVLDMDVVKNAPI